MEMRGAAGVAAIPAPAAGAAKAGAALPAAATAARGAFPARAWGSRAGGGGDGGTRRTCHGAALPCPALPAAEAPRGRGRGRVGARDEARAAAITTTGKIK